MVAERSDLEEVVPEPLVSTLWLEMYEARIVTDD
jgi:hypothetical protein